MTTSPEQLTLEEKCRLLGGASTWRTHAIERLAIPAVKMSDGPNGVRGDSLGAQRTPGIVIPVGIALGATWNPELVGELGDLLGKEAVRKGAHVLLAPTVNLHRTPIGGRVFEAYSEDPELTARLAVAFVRGVQAHDVAVTVKHFAANDTEIDRMTVDARVGERALRELYLRPFEAAVLEAGAWGIMSAYNRLNGDYCAENRWLLTDVLRDEWGFDGFVVSDWFGSHDTEGAVRAGLNVPMPGPRTIYGEALHAAVEAGVVAETALDPLVADLLRLIDRTRARERDSEKAEETVDDPDERALVRRAAADGMVLVRNRGALPLAADATVAVIGPNAEDVRIMGGGSSSLQPLPVRSLLDALSDRVGSTVHEPGVRIDRLPPTLGRSTLRTPDGEPGILLEYRNGHDEDGEVVVSEVASSTMLRLFGSVPAGVDPDRFHITLRGSFVARHDGLHVFSAVQTGGGRMEVGGTVVFDDPARRLPRGPLFFGQASEDQTGAVECRAGEPVPVEITCTGIAGFVGVRLGVRVPEPVDLMDRAVAAARECDVAVVVVGTNDEWETEGEDRSSLQLPGDQDDLVRRVAAANPRTVVVVNAGSPVTMPWLDEVDSVLVAYFGGNEMGEALADVLTGAVDPGGRLPVTYPVRLEDTPAWPGYQPVMGVQAYDEGLLIGYRGFDASGTAPLLPFGHGLSYGGAEWGPVEAPTTAAVGEAVTVRVPITGTGPRAATVVVQGYVAPVDPAPDSAPKQLAGWHKLVVAPGSTEVATVVFPADAFRRWDTSLGRWVTDPGPYDLHLAASAGDIRGTVRISLG